MKTQPKAKGRPGRTAGPGPRGLTRREFLRTAAAGGAALAGGGALLAWMDTASGAGGGEGPNVLMISVDDLRPVLGCYGYAGAKTPHIDALARQGTVFLRAYCQSPSCLPSRTSLLTGLRPDTTGVRNNRGEHFRRRVPNHVTLPQHFRDAGGHWAMELGKVFHERDPKSWSQEKWIPPTDYAYPIYRTPRGLAVQKQQKPQRKPADWWGYEKWIRGLSWEAPDVADGELFDGMLADKAIELLRQRRGGRFFLAAGFFRPHLPFIAPKRYYDLYPPSKLSLPENLDAPAGAPAWCTYRSQEARSYVDVPAGKGVLPKDKQLELLRGYLASVSYVDAQVGRVLKTLDALDLRDRTVIVLWGDHGYHFGEHGTWNKQSNFEEATRSTLLVATPQQKRRGTAADGIVELVDVYPTLCSVCGLETPRGLEGVSFAPLLDDPKRAWKRAAFSQADPSGHDGHTIRTDRYRLVEWRRNGEIEATELYDRKTDPGENVNVAGKAEHAEVLADLRRRLKAGWRGELPANAS